MEWLVWCLSCGGLAGLAGVGGGGGWSGPGGGQRILLGQEGVGAGEQLMRKSSRDAVGGRLVMLSWRRLLMIFVSSSSWKVELFDSSLTLN